MPEYVLASPVETTFALAFLLADPATYVHVSVSLLRIIVGFSAAALVGVPIGCLAGSFRTAGLTVLPLNSAARYIPPTAFIGLVIIWFGIGEGSKVFLIALAVVFYLVQMSADVISGVPRVYREAALALGATSWEVFARVQLRSSVGDLLAVLRVNLGAAWTYLIVAEVVAAQSGLGYLIAVSQRFVQTPRLFALLVIIGCVGFGTDRLLAIAIRVANRWR